MPATGYWHNKIHKLQPGGEVMHTPSAGVPKPWRSVPFWPRAGPKRVAEHVRKLDSTISRWEKNMAPTAVRRSLPG